MDKIAVSFMRTFKGYSTLILNQDSLTLRMNTTRISSNPDSHYLRYNQKLSQRLPAASPIFV